MTLISQSAGYLNFYNTVALLAKEYAPADYVGFYANTTDIGPVTSNGTQWAVIGGGASSVSVLSFGADPTGVADSTAAMIAAHATGKIVYYPAGTYKFSSAGGFIAISGGGIIGDGSYQTFLYDTATGSNDCFHYIGAFAGRFENFQLAPNTTKSGGYGIVVVPATSEVRSMRFFQIVLNALPNGISFVAASRWTVLACQIFTCSGDYITVNNTNVADSGDSCITNCDFENNSPGSNLTSNGIRQIASGGLKVTACKFNNLGIGYLLDLGLSSTSDILLTANSIENSHVAGIQLQCLAGAASFPNINIIGNQILVSSTTGASFGIFSANAAAGFLFRMNVTANTIFVSDVGVAYGIYLDKISGLIVEANHVTGQAGSSVGIRLLSNNSNAKYGVNQVAGFTLNTQLNAAATDIVATDNQTGTTSVTTSTGVGSLFFGTAVVTFPTAFASSSTPALGDCAVAITTAGGGGGISATPTSVSATQLTFQVTGVTNGGSVPVRWSVKGVF